MIIPSQTVKSISDEIANKSFSNASFFPIDRAFLEDYFTDLKNIDAKEFLVFNLQNYNSTYVLQLFLCLPELWDEISAEDIIWIMKSARNVLSFFALIEFVYKYIEIDMFNLIFEEKILKPEWKNSLKEYLKNQYSNLIKSEGDYIILNKALGTNYIDEWIYIKQKLLIDNRLQPALESTTELKKYITVVIRKLNTI